MSYDPKDVKTWEGVDFHTSGGHKYSIKGGKIYGRKSLEGAEVVYVNAMTEDALIDLARGLGGNDKFSADLKMKFDRMALKTPRAPKEGLLVVMGISDKDAEEKKRLGLYTSKIVNIHRNGQR